MILGIGTDLTNITRIKTLIDRYGDKFRNKVFSKSEQKKAWSKKTEAANLAKRWAAKEACSKALGVGFSMKVSWRDITISNLKSGQPTVNLHGWAKKRLNDLTPNGYQSTIHVSLTDDYPWAQAFVLIDINLKIEQEFRKSFY